jgi:hypothetical protein
MCSAVQHSQMWVVAALVGLKIVAEVVVRSVVTAVGASCSSHKYTQAAGSQGRDRLGRERERERAAVTYKETHTHTSH